MPNDQAKLPGAAFGGSSAGYLAGVSQIHFSVSHIRQHSWHPCRSQRPVRTCVGADIRSTNIFVNFGRSTSTCA
jgi:hypothetical protein